MKVRQVMVVIDAQTERASPISTELVEAMSAFVPPLVGAAEDFGVTAHGSDHGL